MYSCMASPWRSQLHRNEHHSSVFLSRASEQDSPEEIFNLVAVFGVASHAGVFRGARIYFGEGRNTSSPENACVGSYFRRKGSIPQDFSHRLKTQKHQLYTAHKKNSATAKSCKEAFIGWVKMQSGFSFQTVQINTTFQVIYVFIEAPLLQCTG